MMRIVCCIVVLYLGGCASTETLKLATTTSSQFLGKPIHVVREKPDPFLPLTASKGAFAVLGVAAAVEDGKQFVQQTSLQDPSHELEDRLAELIIAKFQLSGQGETLDFVSLDRPSDLVSWSRKKGMSGLILDVETKGWGYRYDGFSFSDYIVSYAANFQLIDVQGGKVIASHSCGKDTKALQDGKVYRQEELVADNGALLKQLFAALSQSCLEEFKSTAL